LEVKATIDGKVVGAAIWLKPVDRTSTGGDPLPHEVEIEEMLAAKEQEVGRAAWELDMDKTIDQVFYSKFKKTMKEIRKDWSKGAPHWYLVRSLHSWNDSSLARGSFSVTGLTSFSFPSSSFPTLSLFSALPPPFGFQQSYLFVDPEYQGCGVGAALMKFGTDQADAAGLSTWLESTIAVSRVVLLSFPFPLAPVSSYPLIELAETEPSFFL